MSDDTDRILQAFAVLRGEVNEQIGGIRAELADVRADLTNVRVGLMARTDRLQDEVSAIRDDIATNFGATDTFRRAHQQSHEETRSLFDLVMNMERQIQRLQSDVRTLRGG